MSEVKYTGAPSLVSTGALLLEQLKNKKALNANKIDVIFFIKSDLFGAAKIYEICNFKRVQ
jgi:hypothetical protein